jgi:hypothetical protein
MTSTLKNNYTEAIYSKSLKTRKREQDEYVEQEIHGYHTFPPSKEFSTKENTRRIKCSHEIKHKQIINYTDPATRRPMTRPMKSLLKIIPD